MRCTGRAAALTILTLATVPAFADAVRMKSGDLVSGKIEEVRDDEILIDPDFSDPVEIKFKYIAAIETSQPVTIKLDDGRRVSGFVELGPDGKMRIRRAETRWDRALRERKGWFGDEAPPPEPASQPEPVPLALDDITEMEPSRYRYEANLELGLNASSGNSDSSAFNVSASLEPAWGPNSVAINGQANRRTSDGTLNADDWRVTVGYQRDFGETWNWFWSLGAQFESNPFQELDRRTAVGTGVGYKFYDSARRDLSAWLGPAWVREDFTGVTSDHDYAAALWSLNFEQELFSSDVTLYHKHNLIKSLTDAQFVASTVQGVKFDLFGDLDLDLEFQFDYTRKPPPGSAESNDLRYIVKLEYEFEGDESDWFH